jgi:hypothetical protein
MCDVSIAQWLFGSETVVQPNVPLSLVSNCMQARAQFYRLEAELKVREFNEHT